MRKETKMDYMDGLPAEAVERISVRLIMAEHALGILDDVEAGAELCAHFLPE